VPVRRPHPEYRCPVCDAPLSLNSVTAAGYDEWGGLPPPREFRRCLQCLAISWRVQGEVHWKAAGETDVPGRVLFLVSRL